MLPLGAVHLFFGTASTALEANVPLWPFRNHLGGSSVRLQPIIRVSDAHLFLARPCPFYQKQRCLFNDSCNFIHGISAKPVLESVSSKFLFEDGRTPRNPPRVIVDSPPPVLSPNRSPRTTGLLLALKDVIGDPDDGISTYSWSESLPTLVNNDSFDPDYNSVGDADWTVEPDESCVLQISSSQESLGTQSSSSLIAEDASKEDATVDEAIWAAPSDYANNPLRFSTSLSQESVDTFPFNILEDETVKLSNILKDSDGPPTSSSSSFIKRFSMRTERSSGLLSPIEISTLDLGPFRQSRSSSFTTPFEGSDWKQPSPLQPSPPRSPSIASTMAEMRASPFGSHAARILSPRLSVFLAPSPNLSATASPLAQQEIEQLDLSLDSPEGYPIPNLAPLNVEDITSSWNDRKMGCEDEDGDEDEDDEEDFVLEESHGNTSIWNSEPGQTSVSMDVDAEAIREQVTDAITRANRTPTHFLLSPGISFSENGTGHSSLILDDTINGEDDCIQLPRALTELMTHTEFPSEANDSLNSLYDIYSGLASPQDILADSIRNAHLSPLQPEATLSNISRERVFTPPPALFSRIGNAEVLESPSSLTSLDSVSGRGSPFSQLDHEASTLSIGKDVTEPTESRKVPIASRSRSKRVCLPSFVGECTHSPRRAKTAYPHIITPARIFLFLHVRKISKPPHHVPSPR